MAKSLWGFYNGEPYLENRRHPAKRNPHLVVLNSPKGKKKMARRRSKSYMAWVRSHRRKNPSRHHRRARRNPWPAAGMVVANPRRRVRYYARHYRRARHNPMKIGGFSLPFNIKTVALGGLGFMAVPYVEGFVLPYIPVGIKSNMFGKYAIKIGCAALVGFLGRKAFGTGQGNAVAIGAGINVAVSAINQVIGMSGYYTATGPGMGAYSRSGAGLGAYTPAGSQIGSSGLGAPYNVAVMPSRFRRFT